MYILNQSRGKDAREEHKNKRKRDKNTGRKWGKARTRAWRKIRENTVIWKWWRDKMHQTKRGRTRRDEGNKAVLDSKEAGRGGRNVCDMKTGSTGQDEAGWAG